jgi:Cytochrome P460
MQLKRGVRIAGALLALAVLWAVAGHLRPGLNPLGLFSGTLRAAPPKAGNPCNPNSAKAGNPCNPNGAKAAKADNPCNPKAGNPCNPKAGNPCNPNGANASKAGNPCNPNGAKVAKAGNPCNPNGGKAGNPCNPGAARPVGLTSDGGKIEWGRDFHTWKPVTGFVISNSHGNRLVQTYIDPPEAARVYKHNAELSRLRKTEGYEPYPPGTRIMQESWLRNDSGGPGKPGPLFFMRKEAAGYDASGGDWEYGFTQTDLALVGEGHDGKMGFCKECHTRADKRDFVFATDR